LTTQDPFRTAGCGLGRVTGSGAGRLSEVQRVAGAGTAIGRGHHVWREPWAHETRPDSPLKSDRVP